MSNEIKCPHCGEAFTVDESGYAAILNQVRDQEFQREVDARVSLAEKSREQEVALAVTKAEEALRAQIAERDGQIAAQAERFKAQAKDFQLAAQNENGASARRSRSRRRRTARPSRKSCARWSASGTSWPRSWRVSARRLP